jgi:hypothetical protein
MTPSATKFEEVSPADRTSLVSHAQERSQSTDEVTWSTSCGSSMIINGGRHERFLRPRILPSAQRFDLDAVGQTDLVAPPHRPFWRGSLGFARRNTFLSSSLYLIASKTARTRYQGITQFRQANNCYSARGRDC